MERTKNTHKNRKMIAKQYKKYVGSNLTTPPHLAEGHRLKSQVTWVTQTMKNGKQNIVYRRATVDDIPVLVEYRVRFLNELYSHPENDETRVIRKSLLKYFTNAIPSSDFVAWVADYDGKVIATAGMVVQQIPARYGGVESGKFGYLLNFYTIPEARRKGIATRLLNELIKEAKSLGLRSLRLHASKDGINIYRKAGFVEPTLPELILRLE